MRPVDYRLFERGIDRFLRCTAALLWDTRTVGVHHAPCCAASRARLGCASKAHIDWCEGVLVLRGFLAAAGEPRERGLEIRVSSPHTLADA